MTGTQVLLWLCTLLDVPLGSIFLKQVPVAVVPSFFFPIVAMDALAQLYTWWNKPKFLALFWWEL